MRAYEIIARKRDGKALSEVEIEHIVDEYVGGSIEDGPMAAFLMAALIRGLSGDETLWLTRAMAASGDTVDLSSIPGIKVDKHSTGGVGDKVTLVVSPMVAAAGAPVAKMSGRGLGHTGGTVDKLESIPGYRTELALEEFIANVQQIGISLIGQSERLAPADKKIYALRDVTATVESIPLIASSIMSKKLVCGADAVVLDVTVGKGAFMKEEDEAVELAETMVEIGEGAGKRTLALITDMEQPLGHAVGNSLEVLETIQALRGDGPKDLLEVSLRLGGLMLYLSGKVGSPEEGGEKCEKTIGDGSALDKFAQLVKRQGGDPGICDETDLIAVSDDVVSLAAKSAGFVHELDALKVGNASLLLGAGRMKKGEDIDPSVGIALNKKIGDKVDRGEELASLYCGKRSQREEAIKLLEEAYVIGTETKEPPKLVKACVTASGATRY